jgi:sarcosine oxidase subunit alpha
MSPRRFTTHAYYNFKRSEKPVQFLYNGQIIDAFKSDTIASALFATGKDIFSRSFKYHRPRGIYDYQGLGTELLFTVDGTPNVLGDKTTLHEGMNVTTQNAWPSVHFDLMAINNKLVPLLPNGFYYKMFHKPKWVWPFFEKIIRKAAGLGKIDVSGQHVDKRYEKVYRFPEVCVIGGGPAGLAAAKAALDQGKKVLLIEEEPKLGGHGRHHSETINDFCDEGQHGKFAFEIVAHLIEDLVKHPNLEVMVNTNVFAIYEDNLVAAQDDSTLYKIRAEAIVVCSGATDRHQVFQNNDIPGVLTGRGVERLIALHHICPTEKTVVVTTHRGGYLTAKMLHGAGAAVLAIIDSRTQKCAQNDQSIISGLDIDVQYEQTIHAVDGYKHVKRVHVGDISGTYKKNSYSCDSVVMAVGFKTQLNLLAMGNQKPKWCSKRQLLRIKDLPDGLYMAGENNGFATFSHIYDEGHETGLAAARGEKQPQSHRTNDEIIDALPADINCGGSEHFICKCMDVTRKEACNSIAEGYDQVETLKRYSSMGMGLCQGKTCHESVARLTAEDTDLDVEAVPTTMRPPFSPVPFGILAGRAPHLVPVRRTPMHYCHAKLDAVFMNAGQWKRVDHYKDAIKEAKHVRDTLGIIDVSTLGKLQVEGPDAIKFLHMMFPGKFAKLGVGKIRYAIMIGEDGILFEDGTISHIEDGKYYITTTTGNQASIVARFWFWLTQYEFDIQFKNLSGVFAAVNVAGKRSREFLQKHVTIDMTNNAFPYMACRTTELFGIPVSLFRIGFTGELGYEIHFPAEYGDAMWQTLMTEGEVYHLQPFGVESQRILRLEKGHLIPGVDTDALSNPYEAGVGFAIKDDKEDFVGKTFLKNFKERGIENKLVTYQLESGAPIPPDGVMILKDGQMVGRVTSSRFSPTLDRPIGLAWVRYDLSAVSTKLSIRLENKTDVTATILDHGAFDPDGKVMKA